MLEVNRYEKIYDKFRKGLKNCLIDTLEYCELDDSDRHIFMGLVDSQENQYYSQLDDIDNAIEFNFRWECWRSLNAIVGTELTYDEFDSLEDYYYNKYQLDGGLGDVVEVKEYPSDYIQEIIDIKNEYEKTYLY